MVYLNKATIKYKKNLLKRWNTALERHFDR